MSWLDRILVIRPDRIGDAILSTPVFDALKAKIPKATLTALVRPAVAPLFKSHPSVDAVLIYDPEGEHAGLKGLFRLSGQIGLGCYGAALVLQTSWKPAVAAWFAGVPLRVGPLSQIHTRFLFNRPLRQHRSRSDRNEADYNLELASLLWEGPAPGREEFPARIVLPDSTREQALQWLVAKGWKPGLKLVGIHPGMGGSALNWPKEKYWELTRALLQDGCWVVVTGGPAEAGILSEARQSVEGVAGQEKLLIFGGDASPIDRLGGIFSWCSAVVAPSTGPLHLASALGTPVVGFYPPIRVQSATRWGPFASDPSQVTLFTPQVPCPEAFRCAGPKCPHHDCMQTLTAGQALTEVKKYL